MMNFWVGCGYDVHTQACTAGDSNVVCGYSVRRCVKCAAFVGIASTIHSAAK